jgi:O-antigen/teichoic acid export membrane protein
VDNIGARLLKNTSAQLLNQAVPFISSFAITIPLARLWGAAAFGKYSFAIAFAGLFTFSFDWGLNWLLTREVARNKENVARYLNNALGLTFVLSLVTMTLLIVLINIFDYSSEIIFAVYLAGVWTLLEVFTLLFIRGTFYAFERMEYETPTLLAEKSFAVVLGLAVIFTHSGLIALMLVLVASKVIKLVVCIAIYTRKIGSLGLEFDWRFCQGLVKSAFPFGLNLAFGLIYTKIDITMLSLLRGDEAEIGFYRAALALITYLPLVAVALTSSLFPIMSGLYLSKRESFVLNYQRSVQLLFSIGLPMAIGLCLLGDKFVLIVYGENFEPSIVSLRILSLSVILKFMHGALAMVLTSSNRQGLRTSVIAFAALGNIAMNFLLIPWKGYVGASFAAVLIDSLILVIFYIFISRQLGRLPLLAVIARPTLSGIAMGLYAFFFRWIPLLILIPSAAAIYMVVLYGLGGLPTDELAKLKGMLPVRWLRWTGK